MANPKLFISYFPSGPEHFETVLQTAAELRESGVDVRLDKWDLPEGGDEQGFVERMVADAETKVAIFADKNYAEKAAPPVISRALYESQPPGKFALVIIERDENDEPYVPEYYRSGVFFDLSRADIYSDNFDRLVRWTCGKPLYAKPPLGAPPVFADENASITLGTAAACRRAIEAVQNHRSTADGRIDEYLTRFAENLERFRIKDFEGEIDEVIYKNIRALKPFRDEYLRLLTAIAGYRPPTGFPERLHRFFEQLISYTRSPDHLTRHSDSDLDNFMFIVHELFLHTIAVFLKYEMFAEAAHLLSEKYYLAGKAELGQEELITFDNFHQHIESLEQLNQRLALGHEAIRADMIRERSAGPGFDLRYLMQADFTIFMRAEVDSQPYYSQWWPETLTFLGHFRGAFEIFIRARSRAYFEKMKIVLNIENPADLDKLINSYEEEMRQLPRGLTPLSPARLIGFESLATQP